MLVKKARVMGEQQLGGHEQSQDPEASFQPEQEKRCSGIPDLGLGIQPLLVLLGGQIFSACSSGKYLSWVGRTEG